VIDFIQHSAHALKQVRRVRRLPSLYLAQSMQSCLLYLGSFQVEKYAASATLKYAQPLSILYLLPDLSSVMSFVCIELHICGRYVNHGPRVCNMSTGHSKAHPPTSELYPALLCAGTVHTHPPFTLVLGTDIDSASGSDSENEGTMARVSEHSGCCFINIT